MCINYTKLFHNINQISLDNVAFYCVEFLTVN